MGGIEFLRNIDLMQGMTKRAPLPSKEIAGIVPTEGRKYSRIIWDDLTLINNGLAPALSPVVALSQIVNCVSLFLQPTIFGSNNLGGNSLALIVRDSNAGYNNTSGIPNGIEVFPGEIVMFESDEFESDGKFKFIEPGNFSIQVIFPNAAIVNTVIHIGYGVISQ